MHTLEITSEWFLNFILKNNLILRRSRIIKYHQMKKSKKKSNQPNELINKISPNKFLSNMVSEDMRYKILILKALWVSGHRWEVRLFKLLIIIKINFVLFNIGHWKCNKTPIFKWYWTWILTCIMFCKGQMVYLKKSLFTLLFRVIF